MGQAKLRGTRAERVMQAQQRDMEARAERERIRSAERVAESLRVSEMSPVEQKMYRDRKHSNNMRMANLVGVMIALSAEGRK